jgi:hypothetical protein
VTRGATAAVLTRARLAAARAAPDVGCGNGLVRIAMAPLAGAARPGGTVAVEEPYLGTPAPANGGRS